VTLFLAVVGGLLTSTCLTLFVVPILYSMLIKEGDVGKADRDLARDLGEEPEEEPATATAAPAPAEWPTPEAEPPSGVQTEPPEEPPIA
jgi:hypothetical protein